MILALSKSTIVGREALRARATASVPCLAVIRILAKIFRGLQLALGATPPPPGRNEGKYVAMWFAGIGAMLLFIALVMLIMIRIVTPGEGPR
jgi:hypothetical protein